MPIKIVFCSFKTRQENERKKLKMPVNEKRLRKWQKVKFHQEKEEDEGS